jgi:peptidoglycan/LPS O-acetylase OafA/YrhL
MIADIVTTEAPGLAALVAMVVVIAVLALGEPVFTRAVGLHRTPVSRIPAMDGLRGLAALAVVVHHCIVMGNYLRTGVWGITAGHLAEQLGSLPVAVFFMISAYLFVGALLRNDGKVDPVRLFDGRIMRIAPLYVFAVAVLCLFVAIETHFVAIEPPLTIANEVGHWALFGFSKRGAINGFAPTFVLLSQIWTLRYEWILYALIPVMALGYRFLGRFAVYVVLGIATVLSAMFAFFVAGTLVAEVAGRVPSRWRRALDGVGAAALVATVVLFARSDGVAAATLLAVFFVAAIEGGVVRAAFSGPTLRALGTISYSLYLIHAFPLWIVSHWVMAPATFARLTLAEMVAVDAGVALASIALAIVTYRVIEAPLMARRLFTRRTTPLAANG